MEAPTRQNDNLATFITETPMEWGPMIQKMLSNLQDDAALARPWCFDKIEL